MAKIANNFKLNQFFDILLKFGKSELIFELKKRP